jgi:hypothetical protein
MDPKLRNSPTLGWAFQSEALGELITAEDLPELSCDDLSALLQELRVRLTVLDCEMESHACRAEQQGIAADICLALADLETFLSDFARRVLGSLELCELRPARNWGRKTIQLRCRSTTISKLA